jgi:hypothetical protein
MGLQVEGRMIKLYFRLAQLDNFFMDLVFSSWTWKSLLHIWGWNLCRLLGLHEDTA